MITTDEWDKIMVKLLKDRQSKIKIKQVIRGNDRGGRRLEDKNGRS